MQVNTKVLCQQSQHDTAEDCLWSSVAKYFVSKHRDSYCVGWTYELQCQRLLTGDIGSNYQCADQIFGAEAEHLVIVVSKQHSLN